MWSTFTATPSVKRSVLSVLGAVVVTVAIPQAGWAAPTSDLGLWKVTSQSIGPSRGRMVIERVRNGEAVNNGSTFVVISKGKAYLATPASIAGAGGATAVNYNTWSNMKLEHIGTNIRAIVDCGSRCQHGFYGDRMTVTFRTVKKPPQPAPSVVALEEEE